MFRRSEKYIFLIFVICSANLLAMGTVADPLQTAAVNDDIAESKSLVKENVEINAKEFGITHLFSAALQGHKQIGELSIERYAWGEKLDGLRIGISQVRRPQYDKREKPQFHVALQNVGTKDLVLNLGIMLANGKEQYSTAVKLIFRDSNGKTYEFHNNMGRHGGIAGRVDPFVVPLAVGCTYVLRVDFDNYWYTSRGAPQSLPKGEYRAVAVFEGKAANFINLDMKGIRLMSYWTGTIKSKELLFTNPGRGTVFQKPKSVVSEKSQRQQLLQDHTEWISQSLRRIQSIKPGATRAELLEVCTTEGGISTRSSKTYVYRECPYIKIDVEFKPIDDGKWDEKPEDVITKISKPYLEWSIIN